MQLVPGSCSQLLEKTQMTNKTGVIFEQVKHQRKRLFNLYLVNCSLKPTITRKMGIQEKIQAVDSFPSSDENFPAAKGNKNEIQT